MNSSDIIKEIRERLNISQAQLADAVGVTFATVNRWEKGHYSPSQIAINALKRLCVENNIDYSQFEGNSIISSTDTVRLYHGSKSGIVGTIQPNSRDLCDFGKGFYMGTEITQPLTLICNFLNAKLYTVDIDLTDLKIIDIEVGLDWALLVAFNRGKMDAIKDTPIYEKYKCLTKDCDLIIGFIADDRMFVVLDRFFSGEITDIALINSLSALKLGKQYVAITNKACSQIKIIEEKGIDINQRSKLKETSAKNRTEGIALAEDICRKYRREGRFFDEILSGGK